MYTRYSCSSEKVWKIPVKVFSNSRTHAGLVIWISLSIAQQGLVNVDSSMSAIKQLSSCPGQGFSKAGSLFDNGRLQIRRLVSKLDVNIKGAASLESNIYSRISSCDMRQIMKYWANDVVSLDSSSFRLLIKFH